MRIGSHTDIASVVDNSAIHNVSQLVSREDGTTVVPVFDWTSFFAGRMKKLTGIKKFHHFFFDSAKPGEVVVKVRSDSVETRHELLKRPWTPDPLTLPDKVPPRGL